MSLFIYGFQVWTLSLKNVTSFSACYTENGNVEGEFESAKAAAVRLRGVPRWGCRGHRGLPLGRSAEPCRARAGPGLLGGFSEGCVLRVFYSDIGAHTLTSASRICICPGFPLICASEPPWPWSGLLELV